MSNQHVHTDDESLASHPGEGFSAGGFNSGLPHRESEVQAWFHVVFSSVMVVVAALTLFKMYEARNVLEIRARSAYLVMTLGCCLLLDFAMDVHVECWHLFGWPMSVQFIHLFYFFKIFTLEACFIWRVVRLGVSFNQRIRRAVPWVMSEKLAVISSLVVGTLATFIPAYFYITARSRNAAIFALMDGEIVWKSQVALISIQLCLLPIVWMVDDIFRISWELACIIMLGIVDIVVIRLAETSALTPGLKEVINSANIGLLWTSAVFGLSVIDPIRRLRYNPLARPIVVSRKSYTKGLRRRLSRMGPEVTDSAGAGTDPYLRSLNSSQDGRSEADADSTISGPSSVFRTGWSYERIAAVPAVAEAFGQFVERALCSESLAFLNEVAKYESGDFGIAGPTGSQYAAFSEIVTRFIADGALDEINIGCADKDRLLFTFKGGSTEFFALDDEERRRIFRQAYVEIRAMLETNLLHRFLHTEGFRDTRSTNTPEAFAAGEP